VYVNVNNSDVELYLEDSGGSLQLVSSMLTEHEERNHVAGDAQYHNGRRQPDLYDVSLQ